jgi:hypothetical protein
VDLVPDPLLLRKSCSACNRTRISGSVARNSDHRGCPADCRYYLVFENFCGDFIIQNDHILNTVIVNGTFCLHLMLSTGMLTARCVALRLYWNKFVLSRLQLNHLVSYFYFLFFVSALSENSFTCQQPTAKWLTHPRYLVPLFSS